MSFAHPGYDAPVSGRDWFSKFKDYYRLSSGVTPTPQGAVSIRFTQQDLDKARSTGSGPASGSATNEELFDWLAENSPYALSGRDAPGGGGLYDELRGRVGQQFAESTEAKWGRKYTPPQPQQPVQQNQGTGVSAQPQKTSSSGTQVSSQPASNSQPTVSGSSGNNASQNYSTNFEQQLLAYQQALYGAQRESSLYQQQLNSFQQAASLYQRDAENYRRQSDDYQRMLDTYRRDADGYKQQIEGFRSNINNYNSQLSDLQGRYNQSVQQLNDWRNKYETTSGDLLKTKSEAEEYRLMSERYREQLVGDQLDRLRRGSTSAGAPGGGGVDQIASAASTSRVAPTNNRSMVKVDATDSVLDRSGPVVETIQQPRANRSQARERVTSVAPQASGAGTGGYYARRFG